MQAALIRYITATSGKSALWPPVRQLTSKTLWLADAEGLPYGEARAVLIPLVCRLAEAEAAYGDE